ncbi:hypothetical protein A2313_01855 [Candidatus Roizmanbacteria bacterium RIFOXYB2_FULL_41_10]|uniref:HIT domain-containing protein n=1 Tax=Candidatus Roizmanbacteria bacterium RIFOXYA1_FULL_41_12 TaxID=1802082 RepID=A0A1F7K5P4_9BACT|nr:MAG: hypothetical protein A2209_02910 [Candidatus Roizmanbacteria bacterium RIFOXYA1_FULL_41_12]OGK66677.1 MAG: hypothetical protein A2262_03500 [Candidatus Roizmanbacteria bacterium RIFOXYA2_FULL_41_8]OGK67533.1 MAG: hypothetical protein A2377_01660 [Candidatus Roizmanbacteria bacterium RIFOXYB1_FULL_41_27]OGK70940.1 MAG: hypothetical protein A2313_01855 [Candidatus Roizmanbacteria bacterium RIFOXYB2_FULL_41_10]OGK71189.1 MAG: hypothetical protein A2403_00390 [Candidatus Roizmanbacteria bac
MSECIFCQIIEKKLPCYQVYEDDLFLGFLDIYPRTIGHTVLIPKQHYRWTYDVPEFDQYWLSVLKITRAMQKSLKPNFIAYVTHGLQVAHAHIHIMPRDQKSGSEYIPEVIKLTPDKFQEIATRISSQLNQE